MRPLYLILGFAAVALGVIGAFLPLLPTTPLLILAAGLFARSSPRLEAWLVEHPRFGPVLRAWRENGAIPRRAKVLACVGIAIGVVFFWIGARPGYWLWLAGAALLGGSAGYILSRPSSAKAE
ncbi:YbaN family protein [Devosia sp. XJ19-1]|uniref:YbaN family protein n=1 Tax=Devosia ureilytica TaxID=2952754 RepID=A0A9Q4FTM7_9HYPH|nr:YbaN family protein [Devosia ureilytica]MCP8884296.1 YbaN family protein [Devosia ureilytica]MCP8887904.1 YbaN family protein [Devosia ureilytica]